MLAYHQQQTIKDQYLARVRAHREADQILQGYGYWKDGRGCAVGCTLNGDDHFAYERDLGIPVPLAFLEDQIFEKLPVEKAKEWPEQFLSAIRPGADLSKVWSQFAGWLLDDPTDGLIRFVDEEVLGATLSKQVRDAIENVAQLFREACSDRKKWHKAGDAAYAAADATRTERSVVKVTAVGVRWQAAAIAADAAYSAACSAYSNVADVADEDEGEDEDANADEAYSAYAEAAYAPYYAAENAALYAGSAALWATPARWESAAVRWASGAAEDARWEAAAVRWDADCWATASTNAYVKQSEKLLELLRVA